MATPPTRLKTLIREHNRPTTVGAATKPCSSAVIPLHTWFSEAQHGLHTIAVVYLVGCFSKKWKSVAITPPPPLHPHPRLFDGVFLGGPGPLQDKCALKLSSTQSHSSQSDWIPGPR